MYLILLSLHSKNVTSGAMHCHKEVQGSSSFSASAAQKSKDRGTDKAPSL